MVVIYNDELILIVYFSQAFSSSLARFLPFPFARLCLARLRLARLRLARLRLVRSLKQDMNRYLFIFAGCENRYVCF